MKLATRNEAGARNLAAKSDLPKRYAILAPIAKGRHEGKEKYWRHFNELCKPLRDRGIEPVVFPAADEAEAAKAACPDATIYEPTSLGNFAALCEKQLLSSQRLRRKPYRCRRGCPQVTIVGVTDTDAPVPGTRRTLLWAVKAAGRKSMKSLLPSMTF